VSNSSCYFPSDRTSREREEGKVKDKERERERERERETEKQRERKRERDFRAAVDRCKTNCIPGETTNKRNTALARNTLENNATVTSFPLSLSLSLSLPSPLSHSLFLYIYIYISLSFCLCFFNPLCNLSYESCRRKTRAERPVVDRSQHRESAFRASGKRPLYPQRPQAATRSRPCTCRARKKNRR